MARACQANTSLGAKVEQEHENQRQLHGSLCVPSATHVSRKNPSQKRTVGIRGMFTFLL